MRNTLFRRILSGALSLVLLIGICVTGVPMKASAETGNTVTLTDSRSGGEIRFSEEEAVILSEGESYTYTLSAEETGEYWLCVCYCAMPGRQINPEASFTLTGSDVSYRQSIRFARRWVDVHTEERFEKDSNGNEVLPKTQEKTVWQQAVYGLSAESGSAAVKLEKGEYTLTLTMASETVEIGDVRLLSEKPKSYQDYLAGLNTKENAGDADPIILEAELIYAKSDSSLIASYDRSSPSISPNYPDKIALNIVGGGAYSEQGQWIEWSFTVEKAGFYSISARYQQDGLRELGVGRKIYIDGVIPFAEFDNYLFPYCTNYSDLVIADEQGEPYEVYLTAGEHTLRMEVSQTHLEQAIIDLKGYIAECNSMYRRIISITGASPDIYRDYYLDKELPELMPFLQDSVERLDALAASIEACAQDGEGSETAVLHDAVRTFERFIKKPHKIPATLSEFKNRIDSMADLILTLETQSLTLDYITFTPKDTVTEEKGFIANLCSGISDAFGYLAFRFQSFLASFSGDSRTVSGDSERKIKVWINMGDILVSGSASGRDQMQIIRQLSDDSFTTEHGISVEFSLVSAGDTLTQAILAGKGPDVALFVGESTVVNLGIRGVLADMTEMPGYDALSQQVYQSALVPFSFNGGVYAMPETQTFDMMFVRDDIFEELGLKVPQTWEDFYAVQKKLAEKKLEIGIPESQSVFEMFLMQHGGSIYNEECTASALKSQESVEAFTQWTDLYTKHSLPLAFSFVNRFRTGEMPIGIMSYVTYNQLCVAAPEIKDQWSMYPIPATVREDGTTDRSQASVNTGCVVMKGSQDLDAAYEFVSWWIDSSTQTEFGRQVESVLGKSARYNTANAVTFEQLNWTNSELSVLREARRDVTDTPQTMVTYYVSRCISNAFRRVVYSYEKPRDVIYRYSDDLDLEFDRKKTVMQGVGE